MDRAVLDGNQEPLAKPTLDELDELVELGINRPPSRQDGWHTIRELHEKAIRRGEDIEYEKFRFNIRREYRKGTIDKIKHDNMNYYRKTRDEKEE